MKFIVCLVVCLVAFDGGGFAAAQTAAKKSQTSRTSQTGPKHKAKHRKAISVAKPAAVLHPTCELDSGSVGYYYFPANLGAKWTMRVITQIYDAKSQLVQTDTSFSFEHVVSDSNTTLRSEPVLEVESSAPYKAGGEFTARTMPVTYYIDDSVVMFVVNHSLTSSENRFLLVNPLTVGNHWHDRAEDTVVSEIIATHEPVTVPYGAFKNALVVRTRTQTGDLSKYFVPGVGIAKMVYRGWPERLNGTVVVTTELIALDKGDETRSIRTRFAKRNL